MYVIIGGVNEHITGPFKTADAAAKWAKKELPLAKWRIAPLVAPGK
jgi:hypothetical protein